jgi:hypothetical protein
MERGHKLEIVYPNLQKKWGLPFKKIGNDTRMIAQKRVDRKIKICNRKVFIFTDYN